MIVGYLQIQNNIITIGYTHLLFGFKTGQTHMQPNGALLPEFFTEHDSLLYVAIKYLVIGFHDFLLTFTKQHYRCDELS